MVTFYTCIKSLEHRGPGLNPELPAYSTNPLPFNKQIRTWIQLTLQNNNNLHV